MTPEERARSRHRWRISIRDHYAAITETVMETIDAMEAIDAADHDHGGHRHHEASLSLHNMGMITIDLTISDRAQRAAGQQETLGMYRIYALPQCVLIATVEDFGRMPFHDGPHQAQRQDESIQELLERHMEATQAAACEPPQPGEDNP